MDFTKVFCRVNRSLLRHKLDLYGVQNPFLHGKRQAVVINCAVSDFIPITSSVPQGSVLGPCLFLVYINDLSSRMMSLTYKTLQNDLQRLEQQENEEDMNFHLDKCSMLPVTKSKSHISRTYTLHSHTVQVVVNQIPWCDIESNTRFNHHIDGIVTKANWILVFLGRNLKICFTKTKDLAYKSLVRPLLEYASTVWDPASKKNISQIDVVRR